MRSADRHGASHDEHDIQTRLANRAHSERSTTLVEAERERCAKIADQFARECEGYVVGELGSGRDTTQTEARGLMAEDIAAALREPSDG